MQGAQLVTVSSQLDERQSLFIRESVSRLSYNRVTEKAELDFDLEGRQSEVSDN